MSSRPMEVTTPSVTAEPTLNHTSSPCHHIPAQKSSGISSSEAKGITRTPCRLLTLRPCPFSQCLPRPLPFIHGYRILVPNSSVSTLLKKRSTMPSTRIKSPIQAETAFSTRGPPGNQKFRHQLRWKPSSQLQATQDRRPKKNRKPKNKTPTQQRQIQKSRPIITTNQDV